MGERLKRGQVQFGTGLTMHTCHDIRTWVGCEHCGRLGTKRDMIDTSDKQWWHGRCFVKKFGFERLAEMDQSKTARLTLGDLGVDLMRRLVAAAHPAGQREEQK